MQLTSDLFTFPLRDPRWKNKAAVGVLISLIGIVFFPLLWLVSGYGLQVMRRTIRKGDPALPEWQDFADMFLDGLRHWVVGIIFTLPALLLIGCLVSAFAVAILGLPALLTMDEEVASSFAGMGIWLGFSLGMVAFGIAGVLTIPLSFLSLVALTRAVALERLSAAFEFGEVVKLAKAGFGNYLLALVMWYVMLFGVSFVSNLLIYTVIGCVIYPILYGLMILYSSVLQGALFGLAYRATVSEKPALSDTAVSATTPPPPSLPVEAADKVAETAAVAPLSDRAETLIQPSARRDDLTEISGIGPTFAKRLNDAGIVSFADLAAQTADALREITQARATANPQAWIDEAKRRIG